MKIVLVMASLFVFQTSFASLASISDITRSPEVQKLEQDINAQGGEVIGVVEENTLIPGTTYFSVFYLNKRGQIQKIKDLSVHEGPVGEQ